MSFRCLLAWVPGDGGGFGVSSPKVLSFSGNSGYCAEVGLGVDLPKTTSLAGLASPKMNS